MHGLDLPGPPGLVERGFICPMHRAPAYAVDQQPALAWPGTPWLALGLPGLIEAP